MLKRLSFLTILSLMPLCALAQFDQNPFDTGANAPAPKPAWQQFSLPRKTVMLNFQNANPDLVLQFFSRASGINIVKDPSLTQALTITSAKPVSLNDAFTILSTALSLRNFQLQKQGNILVVQASGGGRGRGNSPDFSTMFGGRNQTILKVYPIQFANATAVARVVNDVFGTASAAPTNPFGNRGGGGGGRFGTQVNVGAAQATGGFGQQTPQVHASADDFSNSVIVNATNDQQSQIGDIIKQIDQKATDPFQSVVYKLTYASSDDLATAVQNVLTANAPQGRGGATTSNTDIGQRFQQAARLGSAQASFGTVVSEPRSNSLIVTATPENQVLVKDVIARLDTPISFADSAVVIPLNNANAISVAYLLNQAFQSRVANTNFTSVPGATSTGRTTTGATTNSSTTGGLGRLGGAAPDNQASVIDNQKKEIDLALADPSATSGDLKTNVDVNAELALQGGGFGGFFGGGQQNRNNGSTGSNSALAPQQARDENGRLTNIHNLNSNVTVIPDQNTNSVIVVTSPENMSLIRNILDQLDRIPQQVMIETIICEASLDKSDKLGVEWSFAAGKFFGVKGSSNTGSQNFGLASSAATAQQGFKYTLTAGNLTAYLNALATDTKFQVLSTPRIFTTNNVQAVINISQQIPYVTNTQVDTNGNRNYSYSFENVGVVLTVTPRITSNGYVSMDVNQTADDLASYTSFNAPIVNQRQATTTVSVKDGETIILGGIIRSNITATVNKIPILGDIPILGNLFRSTSHDKSKTELLVFLTPHVVTNAEEARKLRDKGLEELSKPNRDSIDQIIKHNQNVNNTTPKEGGH